MIAGTFATTYRGLTWDHPRGHDALAAAAERSGIPLTWDVHPLEGFESTPIEDLTRDYDVIVLDHPHLGDALLHECLQPLDELFTVDEIEAWSASAVGPSLTSYELDGHLWALPLDAATQVAATRTDLAGATPTLWREVVDLSARVPVALSLAGPHALLTFSSICVALGEEPATGRGFVSAETGRRAVELMSEVARRSPAHTHTLNPIGLLETMSTDDTLAHVPLVYGYVTYADPSRPRPVRFTDAPRMAPGSRPGSTVGGTGLAVSRRCAPAPDLLDHLRWLLSAPVQAEFIPGHAGQPSMTSGWESAAVNAASGDFYLGTRDTMTQGWVRPRHAGYVAFQSEAAEVVREVVLGSAGGDRIDSALGRLDDLHLHHAGVRS